MPPAYAAASCAISACLIVVINVGWPGEGGFEKAFVTNSIGSAESGDHHIVDRKNGRLDQPDRFLHLASSRSVFR